MGPLDAAWVDGGGADQWPDRGPVGLDRITDRDRHEYSPPVDGRVDTTARRALRCGLWQVGPHELLAGRPQLAAPLRLHGASRDRALLDPGTEKSPAGIFAPGVLRQEDRRPG